MNENLQRLETKVENQGSTPQGKVSAAEWNILVAAVKALDAAGIDTETLAKYLKQYQYITTPELEELLKDVTENLDGVVDLKSAQTIEGLKDFVNGFKIGGALVKYDTAKKCFIFTENVLMEKGLAWNSRLENFTEEEIFSITKAVDVDWKTIGKNAAGQLYVINGGGGGNYDPDFLQDYLTNNKYITESALEPYVKTTAINSLLTDYALKSSIPTKLSELENNNMTFVGRNDFIRDNVDANNITAPGAYLVQTGNGTGSVNFPEPYGIMSVFHAVPDLPNKYLCQIFVSQTKLYWRWKLDTWEGWRETLPILNGIVRSRLIVDDELVAGGLRSPDWNPSDIDTLKFPFGLEVQAIASNLSSIPTASTAVGAILETLKWDFNAANQIYYSTGTNEVFFRSRWGGKWRSWRKFLFEDSSVLSPISGTLTVNGNITATKFFGALKGNADTATKLATPCTLWGQSFDGAVNIEGDMEWVNSIRYSTLSSAACIYVYGKDYDSRLTRSDIGIKADIVAFSDKVAIGDITATEALHVHGNILATGRIAWNSSRVLKTEIKEHYLSLEKLAQIKPYQYKWKDGRDDLVHVGAIADEVMEILPETVLTDTLGIHSMDYAQTAFVMAASLTPHVSDHERRIKDLETENKALKAEIEKLKRAA